MRGDIAVLQPRAELQPHERARGVAQRRPTGAAQVSFPKLWQDAVQL